MEKKTVHWKRYSLEMLGEYVCAYVLSFICGKPIIYTQNKDDRRVEINKKTWP